MAPSKLKLPSLPRSIWQPNSGDLIAGESTIMSKDLMKLSLSAIPVSFIVLGPNPPL
jgi:hypothetical protein